MASLYDNRQHSFVNPNGTEQACNCTDSITSYTYAVERSDAGKETRSKKRNKVCYPELSTALEATSLMVIKEILQRVFHKLFSPMRNIELFNEEFLTRCADGGM